MNLKGITPIECWFELSVILINLLSSLPNENFSMFEILTPHFFMIKWVYLLKCLVKRALHINPPNTKSMSWMAKNLAYITVICRFPLKIRKNLNFRTADHIKLVKRALSFWLKGHSKHNYIIRNKRNLRINKSNQLAWIAFHDAQVSFVNSCNDACWFFSQFIMVCVIMVFLALKSRKIGEILEIMTTFFTNISK